MSRAERGRRKDTASEFSEKVVCINRVSKVVKGGRRFSFSAAVVLGDRKGRVGFGKGKAAEVPEAIRKAIEEAKKRLVKIPLWGTTIPHELICRFGAAHILIKPAARGTGLVAGGAVRDVLYVAGVADVLTKSNGSNNPLNTARATLLGLASLKRPEEVARLRGKTVDELMGHRTLLSSK